MLRTNYRLTLLTLILAAQSGLAAAQQSNTTPLPTPTPPKLDRIEPGSDVPATNIPAKRGTQITETRVNGQVTEAEVVSGGSHYYLRPNNQPGNAQGDTIRAPTWKIGEFDLSGKRKAKDDAGQPTQADAPPPPSLPPLPAGPGGK